MAGRLARRKGWSLAETPWLRNSSDGAPAIMHRHDTRRNGISSVLFFKSISVGVKDFGERADRLRFYDRDSSFRLLTIRSYYFITFSKSNESIAAINSPISQ